MELESHGESLRTYEMNISTYFVLFVLFVLDKLPTVLAVLKFLIHLLWGTCFSV